MSQENKYDNPAFFEQYKQMLRSVKGLEGAGEWHQFRKMMPDFKKKRVLDLGCGFGWHCRYAADHGAVEVVGVDLSEKMLDEAKNMTTSPKILYIQRAIEDAIFPSNSFDVVISSLAFHYVPSFEDICKQVYDCLTEQGDFVFSVEHPTFTAQGKQDWYYGEDGKILHWSVDNYFMEGVRKTTFLGEQVTKYHKTMTTYLNTLLTHGFEITGIIEAQPDPEMLNIPGMRDELRRPMMLLVSARKK